MYALLELAKNTQALSEGKIFILTFENKNLQTLVINLNKDQLRASQLSNDELIPFIYSERSIEEFGKKPGRWTLYDSGELYDSIKVLTVTEEVIIETADLIKEEGDRDFEDLFDGNVLGLNSESMDILIKEVLPFMREKLLEEMLRGI